MQPIRILQAVGNMDSGGLETLIMNWYRRIDREKVQFDFLTHTQRPGFYDEEIRSLGGNIYSLSVLDDKNIIKYISDLRTFFTQHRDYAVVHGHHSSLGPFYLHAAYRAGIPNRIAHSHISGFSHSMRGFIKHIITRNYAGRANLLFACSESAGRYMFGSDGNYTVIHNGIDAEKFCFDEEIRRDMRSRLGIDGTRAVVHVGRFHDQKNHAFLIDVFSEIHRLDSAAVLLLVGVGPLEDAMRNKVRALGLEDCVRFLGRRSDVEKILCASDVFVLPSLYEGLPLVLVEAQCSGLCVVCSDTVTEETKLTDNYHIMSLQDSAEAWAKEIIRMSDQPAERSRFSQIIRQCGYDSALVTADMQAFYLQKASQSH